MKTRNDIIEQTTDKIMVVGEDLLQYNSATISLNFSEKMLFYIAKVLVLGFVGILTALYKENKN